MDSMMKKIVKFPNGKDLNVTWDCKKLSIQGKIDTIYESNNCIDEEDPNYIEYYACAIKITKILCKPANLKKQVGDLIEISIDNQPSLITLPSGKVIWQVSTEDKAKTPPCPELDCDGAYSDDL